VPSRRRLENRLLHREIALKKAAIGVNPFRNPLRAQQASDQDLTKSMADDESNPNFKKNPCRSVSIRVPFRCDVEMNATTL